MRPGFGTGRKERGSVAVLAVVMLLGTGCDSGRGPGTAGTTRAAPTSTLARSQPGGPVLACDEYIDNTSPAAPDHVVLGVVSLPVSPSVQELQTTPLDPAGTRLFAKHGLSVRAGASVDLSIVDPTGGQARMGWGNANEVEPGAHLSVRACPAAGSSDWLSFAGGYYLDRPACITLIVRTAQAQAQVRIGVGTPCP